MCGIAGILDFRGAPVDIDALNRMGRVLHHRGPDDAGIYISPESVPTLGFAHSRLSIIDLSAAGRQPLKNEDGSIVIVFNGEIYNFKELRRDLIKRNHIFTSDTDTETIIHLYEELGEDCARELDGMFAFAIWNSASRELLLCRDRAGKKPLFYCMDRNRFLFGSETKALLVSGYLKPEMEPSALPLYLTLGYVPSPGSLFRGVSKLEPGATLTVGESGNPSIKRYWSLSPAPPIEKDERECGAELRRIMTEAVRKRLIADVPLGLFLSGGIDSTIVAGLMSELMDEPVKTFSIGFTGDPRYDETGYAALVAKKFNTEHRTFTVEPDLFKYIERLLWFHDEPYADSSALPTYMVSQITREFVTVALNGDGGDEVFAGYPRFGAVTVSGRLPAQALRAASGILGLIPTNGPASRAAKFAEKAALPFPKNLMRWIVNIEPEMVRDLLSEDFIRNIDDSPPEESFERYDREFAGGTLLGRSLYINLKTYLLDDLLVKMDRMSMANSLETRSPFLDKHLIEFTTRLPDRMKLRGRTTKYLLKKTFADLLPVEILKRPKWGFGVPLHEWFRNELREYTLDLVRDTDSRYRIYFNPDKVEKLTSAHMNGTSDMSRLLWSLVNLEIWLRKLESPVSLTPPEVP